MVERENSNEIVGNYRDITIPPGHSFELVKPEPLQMALRRLNDYLSDIDVKRFHVFTFPATIPMKKQFNGSSASGSIYLLRKLVALEIVPSFLEKRTWGRNLFGARFVSSDGLLAFRAIGWELDVKYPGVSPKTVSKFENNKFSDIVMSLREDLGGDPLSNLIKDPEV